jgi:hypothetical protein
MGAQSRFKSPLTRPRKSPCRCPVRVRYSGFGRRRPLRRALKSVEFVERPTAASPLARVSFDSAAEKLAAATAALAAGRGTCSESSVRGQAQSRHPAADMFLVGCHGLLRVIARFFLGSKLTDFNRRPRRGIGCWGSSSCSTRPETDCSRRLSRRMPPGTAWWGWANCRTRLEIGSSRHRLSRNLWGWSCRRVRWSARRRARGHGQQLSRRREPLWRRQPSVRPTTSGAGEPPAGPVG